MLRTILLRTISIICGLKICAIVSAPNEFAIERESRIDESIGNGIRSNLIIEKLLFGQLSTHLFVECKRQEYKNDEGKKLSAKAQLECYMVEYRQLHGLTGYLVGL